MILSNVVRFESVNSIWISDYNTSGRLFDLRCKSLETGIIKRGFERPVHSDIGDYLRLSNDDFRTGEPVAYQIESISTKDLEEWFASDETVPLIDFLAGKHSDDAQETDNAPADDQDHEQDQQDHEPDNGPGMDQNEPELTTLQCQILQELKENGEGTVAELIDRLNMPGMQAAIRKNLHILMDEKHLIGKRSSTPNGRPAQLWGVM